MDNLLMVQSGHSKQVVQGWGLSCLLHACLALAAFVLMPKMTVLVQQEPFKWDVALVEAPHEVVRSEEPAPAPQAQPPTPIKPRREPVRAAEPPPQPVMRQVETRVEPQPVQRMAPSVERVVQPVQREPRPVVEAVRPKEQIQPPQDVVQVQSKPIEQQERQKNEPVVQAAAPAEVKREVAPAVEQKVVESMPTAAPTYQAQPVVSAPPAVETKSEPVVTAPAPVVRQAPVAAAVEPASADPTPPPPMDTASAAGEPPVAFPVPVAEEPTPTAPAPVATAALEPVATSPAAVAETQPDPATLQEHQVVARAVTPRPATKADYGWLAESLHRRIIELRHYPSTARLNGWEGKVVLKVSIKKDGNLKDVEVVKSSGHESLDQAAMEAVRRACPLHMKHELTAPMVVLHLPVSYSLNR